MTILTKITVKEIIFVNKHRYQLLFTKMYKVTVGSLDSNKKGFLFGQVSCRFNFATMLISDVDLHIFLRLFQG